MKKIIGSKVVDDVIWVCDNCEQPNPNGGSDATIEFNFGYDSTKHDGDRGKTSFCAKCSEDILSLLRDKFPNVDFITRSGVYF